MKKTAAVIKKHLSKDPVAGRKADEFPIVAIGASAGGLEAMTELLKNLAPDTGMTFIYVQHLSPHHESILAQLLAKATTMKVQQAEHKEEMLPNNIYVIPPDKEMFIMDGHIKLLPRPEQPKVNLPIDTLFSSLAEKHKENVIGIILSGSGADGTRGLQAIKIEGGITLAQDDSAKFQSMPKNAIATGVVDFILSPKEIALELQRISKHPLLRSNGKENGKEKEPEIDDKQPELITLLRHLHKQTGVDFSLYKMNTIKRRIQRRMLLHKIKTLKEYVKFVTEKTTAAPLPLKKGFSNAVTANGFSAAESPFFGGVEEEDLLYHDLLITVTHFFRDSEACKYLKTILLPRLLNTKTADKALRIWVAACSTGEEAYSIAIMLKEIQDTRYSDIPVQIFATDLSEAAVSKARTGIYTKSEVENVSPKRLQRFFTKSQGSYRITQSIRDICVFAQHNILSDPPFSHVDLISCCNLLIYFDSAAQKKTISLFHYALSEEGYLMLGKSESLGQATQLFTSVNKKLKLYQRKKNSGIGTLPSADSRSTQQHTMQAGIIQPVAGTFPEPINKKIKGVGDKTNGFESIIDSLLLSCFTPASVVINQQLEILQFRGETFLYLSHASGKATLNIFKMARPEISFELRNAITKAFKTKKPVVKKNIEMNGGQHFVSLEAIPLTAEFNEPLLLIVFTEQRPEEMPGQAPKKKPETPSPAKDRRIKKLEEEMAVYRDELRSITHNHEAAMEELQSANEEVVSSNEELRSLNEELETSKEEIQSASEELATTNQELQTRNELLNESYTYTDSIVSTIHNPFLILDKNLRVKTANKQFYKKFAVTEEETEGMALYDLGNRQWSNPVLRNLLEDVLLKNNSFENFEVEHDFESIGKRIMLLNAKKIIQPAHREQMILLAIADITDIRELALKKSQKEKEALELQIEVQKKTEEVYKAGDAYIRNVFMQAPVSIVVYKGPAFIVDMINERALEMWGVTYKKTINKPLYEISPELYRDLEKILSKVYITGKPYIANEFESRFKRNGKWYGGIFNLVLTPVSNLQGTIVGITSIGTDVTQEVTARKSLEESEKNNRQLAAIVQSSDDAIVGKTMQGIVTSWNPGAEKIFGYTAAEMIGNSITKIIPEERLDEESQILKKISQEETVRHFETRRLTKKGKLIDISLTISPIHDSEGKIIGASKVARDITEQVEARKEIKESEKKYRQLVTGLPVAVCTCDTAGRIVLYNEAAVELWGRKPEVGKDEWCGSLKMFYSDGTSLPPEESPMAIAIKEGRIMQFEIIIERPDGTRRNIIPHPQPVFDSYGKITGATNTLLDITEAKKAEAAIKMRSLEFENAVKERTQELKEANDLLEQKNIELEKMNKELESFTYISSHDLQEPLRKIQTFSTRLLEKENQNLSDADKDYFYRIHGAAQRMQRLIQDLLAFSKINTAERKFELTDLRSITKEVTSEFKESITEKNATVEIGGMCEAKIIPFQFRQLMQNLIGNALKFSKPGIPPRIEIKSEIVSNDEKKPAVKNLLPAKTYCHLSVSDNGIGFEQHLSGQIFQLFQKLHGKDEYPGTGIGLAIVKKIVDNHNGIITATGELNKGATFDIYIPA